VGIGDRLIATSLFYLAVKRIARITLAVSLGVAAGVHGADHRANEAARN
jgi:hypothetical protein